MHSAAMLMCQDQTAGGKTLSVKVRALIQTSTLSYAATLSAAAKVQLVHLQSTRRLDKPYGLSFPLVSIGDMVEAQKNLIDHLGIEKLLAVVGGSMGGMQVLQWMVSYPDKIRSAIPIATTLKHTPQQIAFNEVGRQAVMSDPDWRNGNYYRHAAASERFSFGKNDWAHNLHERHIYD